MYDDKLNTSSSSMSAVKKTTQFIIENPKMHYTNCECCYFLLSILYIIIIIQNNVTVFFQNLWNLFEHVIESKNHVTESLLKELDQSEEQYARNLQSHAETIDELIGMSQHFLDRFFSSVITSESQDSTMK
jgi:predicted PurR-regulated permease PerM